MIAVVSGMTNLSDPGYCAICKGGEREVVQTQSLALLDRNEPCVIHFAVCRGCGHLQQWPPVSPELMRYHYGTFATYELHGDREQLRAAPPSRHAKRFLSLARDIGLAPGRIYEIGCASGEMLNQFRREGWEVRGCDPSSSAITQAQAIFDISADLGGEMDTLPGQRDLDLILACHVLEHLYDPTESLARCHAALASDGHLLLEVPCAIAPDSLPPGWFTFEHLHYYQPAILERLLRQAGFTPVEFRIAMIAEHYPVVAVAARKSTASEPRGATDPEIAIAMASQYARRDNQFWSSIAQKLADITGPVFVYGAGIHTAQLLDHTGLEEKVQILAIADRDSKKWGKLLAGKTVIDPNKLFHDSGDAPVIVSSYVSEREIVRALLGAGIAASRIRPLYSELPA
jgi:SAM-dependent methyltransferase